MDPTGERVLDLFERRDWATLRLTLHPYLHWDCDDGTNLRGRRNVLAMLEHCARIEPPSSVELRDRAGCIAGSDSR